MPPRGLSSRQRKLETVDKEVDKDKVETTDAPTIPPTLAATESPTPVPTLAATTSPPVFKPTKSPDVTVSKTSAPTTRDSKTSVTEAPAPSVSVTQAPSTHAPLVTVTQAPTTQTSTPTTTPTQRPTMSPTATAPVETASSNAVVTREPTLSPIYSTSGPTLPDAAVPTLAPTFSLDSVVQSIHLQFSTWTDSDVTLEDQESSLLEILNVAMCTSGVQLIARNMTDACPPGVWQDLGEPTVIWNQPLAFATPVDASYRRWNFTYSVLEAGNQTQDSLQLMLNESITSGRMDETLQLQWDAPSLAKVVGTEIPITTGVPQQSAEILQIVGIILAALTVLVVWLLTYLARKHRHHKDAKTVQIVFCSNSMEGRADVKLEEMLTQSRQVALQQNPTIPPSLLPAVSSEDDEDDIVLDAMLADNDFHDC